MRDVFAEIRAKATEPAECTKDVPPDLDARMTFNPKKAYLEAGAKVPNPQYFVRNASGTRKYLTKDVANGILTLIRQGTYEWIAALSYGVSRDKLDEFKELYPNFRRELKIAAAQCRADREIWMAENEPDKWLKMGPGRERPGEEGWATQTQHVGAGGKDLHQPAKPKIDYSKYTEEEFLTLERLLAKGSRVEVIEGEVVVVPPQIEAYEVANDGFGADRAQSGDSEGYPEGDRAVGEVRAGEPGPRDREQRTLASEDHAD